MIHIMRILIGFVFVVMFMGIIYLSDKYLGNPIWPLVFAVIVALSYFVGMFIEEWIKGKA